jgi:hypothetical protein
MSETDIDVKKTGVGGKKIVDGKHKIFKVPWFKEPM